MIHFVHHREGCKSLQLPVIHENHNASVDSETGHANTHHFGLLIAIWATSEIAFLFDHSRIFQ
jgi:hypothetical protein